MSKKICDTNSLPLGLLDFSNIRKSNMVYVDKTRLLAQIASQRTPIFFSRPRRFGKSLLINTLASLFSHGLDDFHGLDIEKIWDDTIYKVVHLDFSSFADKESQNFKKSLSKRILRQFSSNAANINTLEDEDPDEVFDAIAQNLENNSIVLLIDEYDAPLTHHLDETAELKNIIKILNNFYSTLKQYTDKFRLIFITGITRSCHVSIFSAFNNLVDLSLKKEFNSLLGFTQEELRKFFNPFIENSAQILQSTNDDLYQRLEQYYDGFQFSLNADETVYNPWSILSFFKYPEDGFKNYWFKSSGSSSLSSLLLMQYLKKAHSFNPLNYNEDLYISEEKLSDRYEITKMPKDILLYQTGYFTLRKKSSRIAKLIFPNTEVEDSIVKLYLKMKNIEPDAENYCKIDELIDKIDKKDLSYIVNIFNAILNDCVSYDGNIFNDERSVRDIIYAALPQEINLQKIKERVYVQGRSDLELLTKKTHLVIEFKRTYASRNPKASLQEAIQQIQKNSYGIASFTTHELFRVAMVISSEEKCILKEFCKEVI